MGKLVRKTSSFLIVVSMFFAMITCLTACSNKPYKIVYNKADSYSESIINHNSSNIRNASSNLSDKDFLAIEKYFDYASIVIPENADIIKTVSDSLSYKVDAGSIKADSKSGSVNVIFTMLDYRSVIRDTKTTNTVDVTVTLKLVNNDDTWTVENSYEAISQVYSFLSDIDAALKPDLSYASCTWTVGDREIEFNTTDISAYNIDYIIADINGLDEKYLEQLYYTVQKDDELIYTSEKGANNNFVFIDAAELNQANERGFFKPGKYTVTFYYGQYVIASDSCTISEGE